MYFHICSNKPNTNVIYVSGIHQRNEFSKPVTCANDWKLQKLLDFSRMVHEWCRKYPKSSLSWQTEVAVCQTLEALVHLATHLLEKHKFRFVMLGKFSSDPIEGRFGWYRQSCGGSYFITVRQILYSEKNIRVLSFMKTVNESAHPDTLLMTAIQQFKECIAGEGFEEKLSVTDCEWLSSRLSELSLENFDTDSLPIVYRVAGYVGRSVARRRRCLHCHELLLLRDESSVSSFSRECLQNAHDFFNYVNRGGFFHPQECLLALCATAFYFMQEIENDIDLYRKFVCTSTQRVMFVKAIMSKIAVSSLSCLYDLKCKFEHCVTPNILFCIFNCFSKSSL